MPKVKLNNKIDFSNYRYTVDYLDDFKLICSMIDEFNKNIESITMSDVINYINSNQDKVKYQKKLFRTIGWQKSLEKDKKYLKLQ